MFSAECTNAIESALGIIRRAPLSAQEGRSFRSVDKSNGLAFSGRQRKKKSVTREIRGLARVHVS